jgi:hypothetical protein
VYTYCDLFSGYPSVVGAASEIDHVLAATLMNNQDKLRKRRASLALSPDVQVEKSAKLRVLGAKLNLSQRFN